MRSPALCFPPTFPPEPPQGGNARFFYPFRPLEPIVNSVDESRTRVYRSPYWALGWVFVALAIALTVAFFAAVDWSEFGGSVDDFFLLAHVLFAAFLFAFGGLWVARTRVESTSSELRIVNVFRSYTVPWILVARFERTERRGVVVLSTSGQATQLGALSLRPQRGWRTKAFEELEATLAARQHSGWSAS